MSGGTGAGAVRAEQPEVVVAEHAPGATVAEERDRFVAEPVLLDNVAGAQQLVDVAHQLERGSEARCVAVYVGDDADPHLECAPLRPACCRPADPTVPCIGSD